MRGSRAATTEPMSPSASPCLPSERLVVREATTASAIGRRNQETTSSPDRPSHGRRCGCGPGPPDHTRTIKHRHLLIADRFLSEESKHRSCRNQRCVLTARIRPPVFVGARDINAARSNQCHDLVLIDGQLIFTSGVRRKGLTEPVRKTACDAFDCLCVSTT